MNRFFYRYFRLILLVFIVFVIFAGSFSFWYFWGGGNDVITPSDMVEIEESFSSPLKTYGGESVGLKSFRGKIVVANFWATWCPYSPGELAAFSEAQKLYGAKAVILGINRMETLVFAKGFSDKLGLSNILFLLDPEDAFFKSIGGYAMPETVIFNANGDIAFRYRGPMTRSEIIDAVRRVVEAEK
jgi:thiol-disulfide isomerase/thioredoxin